MENAFYLDKQILKKNKTALVKLQEWLKEKQGMTIIKNPGIFAGKIVTVFWAISKPARSIKYGKGNKKEKFTSTKDVDRETFFRYVSPHPGSGKVSYRKECRASGHK